MTDERLRGALRPARAGGKRRLTFDNGRWEEYQAVFVQHPNGEWDRILIARDDGSIARLIADLINGTPEPTLDVERLARTLHSHDVPGVGSLWWDADGHLVGGPEDD